MNGQNCLLESPTGTGKTLSILASCLSYMHHVHQTGDQKRLVYISRTHIQLDQVAREIKKLPFNFSMAILASRVYLCMKPSLSSLTNAACTQK